MKLRQYEKAEALYKKLIAEKPDMLILYSQLYEVYFNEGKKAETLAMARQIRDSLDKLSGIFAIGVYYSRTGKMDSAVYYYQLAKTSANCMICDNNIGLLYYVNNKIDSARKYFNLARAADTTNSFPMFNLATIDAAEGKYRTAIDGFLRSINYCPSFTDAFVIHLDLYFKKSYTVTDSSLYRDFRDKAFTFDLQYLNYIAILYCALRDPELSEKKEALDYVFSMMYSFKDEEVLTWYHHACFKALKKDKAGALESIERSLKLGFGNYFMLTSDDDLALIRDTPEFKALLKKYFPDKTRK
jgi:tetratricopeptide (TPR) repeat protein